MLSLSFQICKMGSVGAPPLRGEMRPLVGGEPRVTLPVLLTMGAAKRPSALHLVCLQTSGARTTSGQAS